MFIHHLQESLPRASFSIRRLDSRGLACDLTQLAKSHEGKFPAHQVRATLRFGSGPASHCSADMPVWGPLFRSLDKYHDAVVQQRTNNLVNLPAK